MSGNSKSNIFISFDNPVLEKGYEFLGLEETHPMEAYNQWIPTIDYSLNSPIFPIDQTKDEQNQPHEPPNHGSFISAPVLITKPSRIRRSKKSKKHCKLMTQEELIKADPWNWRKYGTRPIKGSQYPRHYYKCNTDKLCHAKMYMGIKSPEESNFFEIYYLGEHNHAPPKINGPKCFTRTRNYITPKVKSLTKSQELGSGIFIKTRCGSIKGGFKENKDNSEIYYYNDEEYKIELIPNPIAMEEAFMGFQELGIINHHFITQIDNAATTIPTVSFTTTPTAAFTTTDAIPTAAFTTTGTGEGY